MSNKSLQEKVQKLLSDPDTSDSVPLSLFDQQALRIQQLQMKIELIEQKDEHVKSLEESLNKVNKQSSEYQLKIKELEKVAQNEASDRISQLEKISKVKQ
ncbi:unnamed protein product [Rhizophagus irregularis]|nr:unnamed protein product [Rhizophagus irregularis]